jgi:phosphoribosyl 1,2-cyclic phosphodiesterase
MGASSLLLLAVLPAHVAQAQKVTRPNAGPAGSWRLIGQTHADHGADHDTIVVQGPYDNFRRIKFKVTDAPLNMQHMVVTYDNGAPDKIEIRQSIAQGGESRVIDLRGVGKRSLRRIDFWYDTHGFLKGKADVTVFGMK